MRELVKVGYTLMLVAFIGLINSSCGHRNTHPKQTAALDSIAVVLHQTDSALAKVDTVHIKKCVDHIFLTLEDVAQFYKDTVSRGASDILRSFNAVRYELQIFMGKQGVLRKEIIKSVAQVGSLSHDIKINRIPSDSVMMYYGFEMKKASELIETAHHGMNSLKTQLPMYDIILPQADSLISRVKKHQSI